jgi:hypothetical protein
VVLRVLMIVLSFVGSSGFSPSINSQHSQDEQEIAKRGEKSLTVHAEVIRQAYCHVDDEGFSASLDLRLRFTNASQRSVILSRKIEPPSIVRIARSVESAANSDFLYAPDSHFAVAEIPDSPSFGEMPDPKLFILLASGESFETVVPTAVFGINDPAKARKGNGLLATGSYLIQVGVFTWPYEWPYFSAKSDPSELKERWNQYGTLATGLVYSDLAPFTLPRHFKNPRCSSKL